MMLCVSSIPVDHCTSEDRHMRDAGNAICESLAVLPGSLLVYSVCRQRRHLVACKVATGLIRNVIGRVSHDAY